MPPSSQRFEIILRPDPRLRLLLRSSGGLAAATGAAIILAMPVSWLVRIPLLAAWVLTSIHELVAQVRGADRLRALRLDAAGRIACLGQDAGFEPVELLAGSVVLKRLAWIRVRFHDGTRHGELLAGDPATDPAWHRLQLVWKLGRGAFGRPEGS